jgi:heterodisulfide reductase subunit B
MLNKDEQNGIAGHGAFFQDTNLSASEAETATAWV